LEIWGIVSQFACTSHIHKLWQGGGRGSDTHTHTAAQSYANIKGNIVIGGNICKLFIIAD